MAKKMALGKGMASLIPSGTHKNQILQATLKERTKIEEEIAQKVKSTSVETYPSMISISKIITNPNQPRKIFKEKELEELSASIKENGVIQPLIVTETEMGFELIAGERRLRASKQAGLKSVPVVIKKATDKDRMVMSIIENIQRTDLNCVEEALAYYQLMNEFKLTQEEVAKKLGKDRSNIANHLRILKLPKEVIQLLNKEVLTFGHAKVLASVKEHDTAVRLANEAAVECLSVRELEKRIKTNKKTKKITAGNPFFDEKLDGLRQKLEKKTGYHFTMNSSKNGTGQIIMKYSNEAEFNDIYEFLIEK